MCIRDSRYLDPAVRYVVTNLDVPGSTEMSGGELMEEGLLVSLTDRPGAAVITYRRSRGDT